MTIGEHFPNSEINLPSRRKRRVPNWSRPPAPKSIRQLMAERDWANEIAALDPTRRNRAEAQAAETALAEGRERAVIEFGVPHLWRPAKRGFSADTLAGFHNSKRRFRHLPTPFKFFDWGMCYRWMSGNGPAAIVAQPETYMFNLAEAQAFARENELEVSVADTFESWRSPAHCVVVVWTRGRLGGSGIGRNCWMTPRL